jgi:hypothetical protein
MAKAEVLQTRPRGSRHVNVSKRRTHRGKVDVPAELRAPVTAEIEDDLKSLVARFGAEKVLQALDPLITKCKWTH